MFGHSSHRLLKIWFATLLFGTVGALSGLGQPVQPSDSCNDDMLVLKETDVFSKGVKLSRSGFDVRTYVNYTVVDDRNGKTWKTCSQASALLEAIRIERGLDESELSRRKAVQISLAALGHVFHFRNPKVFQYLVFSDYPDELAEFDKERAACRKRFAGMTQSQILAQLKPQSRAQETAYAEFLLDHGIVCLQRCAGGGPVLCTMKSKEISENLRNVNSVRTPEINVPVQQNEMINYTYWGEGIQTISREKSLELLAACKPPVTSAYFRYCRFAPGSLAELVRNSKLEHLCLSNCELSNSVISEIRAAKQLSNVSLAELNLHGIDLSPIMECEHLDTIRFFRCSGPFLFTSAKHTAASYFSLIRSDLSGDELGVIQKAKRLKELHIDSCKISSKNLEILKAAMAKFHDPTSYNQINYKNQNVSARLWVPRN